MIRLFRKCGREVNDRQMVLSTEEQLLSVQLCLAEIHKEVIRCTKEQDFILMIDEKSLCGSSVSAKYHLYVQINHFLETYTV